MADKPTAPKASDLLLGVVDLFGVVAPGLVAVVAIGWALPQSKVVAPEKDAWLLGAMLVLAFILGHMLHGLGSVLDGTLYDPLFKPLAEGKRANWLRRRTYFRSNDPVFRAAGELAGGPLPVGLYQWCRAWLRIHAPEATAAVDRLEADSKFFRNLSVLGMALLGAGRWLPVEREGYFAVCAVALMVCLWRYCDLRQKMVRGCHLYFVLARERGKG